MIDVTARKRSERALLASEGRKDAVLRAVTRLRRDRRPRRSRHRGQPGDRGDVRLDAHRRGRQARSSSSSSRPSTATSSPRCSRPAPGPLLGARLEINALRSDHRTFPAEVAITRVDVPGPLLFAVSLRDVTKRREREERMREAEAKYRTLVEQIPLATYINDTGMPVRTKYMSPQIETMLGFPVSDWLAAADFFLTCLHPDDRDARARRGRDARTTLGEDFRCEYRLIAADGRTRLGARRDGRRARRGVPPALPAGLPRSTSPTAAPPTKRSARAKSSTASSSRARAT